MLHVYDRSLQWTLRHRRFTMGVLALYITPVLYLYMEGAQKYLAVHPISRLFFWRRRHRPVEAIAGARD